MNALLHDPALVVADRWQRDFPLSDRPFAAIGHQHDLTEAEVLSGFKRLRDSAMLSRVGAVVRPHAAGISTLAALSCPPEDLPRVAAIVCAEHGVNHNYEREHAFNLWFVVTALSESDLLAILARIERHTGYGVIDLRLQQPYHIDLGFALAAKDGRKPAQGSASRQATADEQKLLAAMEDGIPLVETPFAAMALRLGWSEPDVREMIGAMCKAGIISRFGCVIRHRSVGYTANAMAVWDVPGEITDCIGWRLAGEPGVTLCYRRPRRPPLPHLLPLPRQTLGRRRRRRAMPTATPRSTT